MRPSRHPDAVSKWGRLLDVVADAMIDADPDSLITIEDESGRIFYFYVSHWGEA